MNGKIARAGAVVPGLAAVVLMLGLVVLPAAESGASTDAAVGFGQPVQPQRGPNGAPQRGPVNQIETSNWSGYAVAHYETAQTYTSATGTWVVPTATLPPGYSEGYSSSWVGIGGFCEDAGCSSVDSTLIQLGTSQDATNTGTSYSAWYELLPSGPVTVPLTIVPGDVVTASLSDGPLAATTTSPHGRSDPTDGKSGLNNGKPTHGGGGSSQSWTLTMSVNGGPAWSTTVSYDSSLLSAEWIEEAPMGCTGHHCTLLPLADYATAAFNPGTADGGSPGLVPSEAVVMVNPNGQTSNPSSPDTDSDGFATCWASGTSLATCSPPTS